MTEEDDEFLKIKRKIASYDSNNSKNKDGKRDEKVVPDRKEDTPPIRSQARSQRSIRKLNSFTGNRESKNASMNEEGDLVRLKRTIAGLEDSFSSSYGEESPKSTSNARKLPPKIPVLASPKDIDEDDFVRLKKKIAGVESGFASSSGEESASSKKNAPNLLTNDDELSRLKRTLSTFRHEESFTKDSFPYFSSKKKNTSNQKGGSDDLLLLKQKISELSSSEDEQKMPHTPERLKQASENDYEYDFRRIKQKIAGVPPTNDSPRSDHVSYSSQEFANNSPHGPNSDDPFLAMKQKIASISSSGSFQDFPYDMENHFQAMKEPNSPLIDKPMSVDNSTPSASQFCTSTQSTNRTGNRSQRTPGAFAVSSRGEVSARQFMENLKRELYTYSAPDEHEQPTRTIEQCQLSKCFEQSEEQETSQPPQQLEVNGSVSSHVAGNSNRSLSPSVNGEATSLASENEIHESKFPYRRQILLASILLLSFILIIAATIFFTFDKTVLSYPKENERYDLIFSELAYVSEPSLFSISNTSQFQALDWIVYNDPKLLPYNDPSLVQRYILVLIYISTNSSTGWFNSFNWLSNDSECQWEGVHCNYQNDVMKIDMVANNLQGSIPSEIRYLTELQFLNLSNNEINCTIPSSIGSLVNLKEINMRSNYIYGTLPFELFTMSKLQGIILDENFLNGSFPEISSNYQNFTSSLMLLSLTNNHLSGFIPSYLHLFQSLKILLLNNNRLNGSIHSSIGKLSQLLTLSLESNTLTGTIPLELCDLNLLRSIHFNDNTEMYGPVPSCIENAISLEGLDLDFCSFDGTIPPTLGNLTSMKALSLQHNFFTGSIPEQLEKLINLEKLTLTANNFEGVVPSKLCSLPNLHVFSYDCINMNTNETECNKFQSKCD